jgi:hypothetical protein
MFSTEICLEAGLSQRLQQFALSIRVILKRRSRITDADVRDPAEANRNSRRSLHFQKHYTFPVALDPMKPY